MKLQAFFMSLLGMAPKKLTVLVVGLDNSGKSTLVKTLQGDLNPRTVPTVGFEKPVTIKINSYEVTFYDLGGGRRIRDVWQKYYDSVHGVIYVVDSADKERILESAKEFETMKNLPKISGKPILVLANKEDLSNRLSEVEIASSLMLDKLTGSPYQIRTCIALPSQTKDKKQDKRVREGVDWLVAQMHKDYGTLTKRVEQDIQVQKEEERKRREAILARIEKEKKAREDEEKQEEEKKAKGEGVNPDQDKANSGDKVPQSNKTTEENNAAQDVVQCTKCKASPAVKRCAASKWEAVCADCAAKLEAAAKATTESGTGDHAKKSEEANDEKGKDEQCAADVIKCTQCKNHPAVRRSAASKWEAVCEECATRLEEKVQGMKVKDEAPSAKEEIASPAVSNNAVKESRQQTGTAESEDRAISATHPAGDVMQQPDPTNTDLCTSCRTRPADRRCGASRWEPICAKCASDMEIQRMQLKKTQAFESENEAKRIAAQKERTQKATRASTLRIERKASVGSDRGTAKSEPTSHEGGKRKASEARSSSPLKRTSTLNTTYSQDSRSSLGGVKTEICLAESKAPISATTAELGKGSSAHEHVSNSSSPGPGISPRAAKTGSPGPGDDNMKSPRSGKSLLAGLTRNSAKVGVEESIPPTNNPESTPQSPDTKKAAPTIESPMPKRDSSLRKSLLTNKARVGIEPQTPPATSSSNLTSPRDDEARKAGPATMASRTEETTTAATIPEAREEVSKHDLQIDTAQTGDTATSSSPEPKKKKKKKKKKDSKRGSSGGASLQKQESSPEEEIAVDTTTAVIS